MNVQRLIFVLGLIYFSVQSVSAQNKCAAQSLCTADFLDGYDFKSQSRYLAMKPGDSSVTNIVLYANQNYRVLVCNEDSENPALFKIQAKTKRPERQVKLISGNDTIWEVKYYIETNEVFHSAGNSIDVYDISPRKTAQYTVIVYRPRTKKQVADCVNILVGRELSN